MSNLLCKIGIHRWQFVDVREGDTIVTWAWCKRKNCPKYHCPRQVNRDWSPLGDEERLSNFEL